MNDRCSFCKIRKNCDILSAFCLLSAKEILRDRPELIRITSQQRADRVYYRLNRKVRIEKAVTWNAENKERRAATQARYRAKKAMEING